MLAGTAATFWRTSLRRAGSGEGGGGAGDGSDVGSEMGIGIGMWALQQRGLTMPSSEEW